MTTKFEKKTRELDGLSMKTKIVKTRSEARVLSLKKWKSIRNMALIFWDAFNTRCGFCGYGEHKASKEAETDRNFLSPRGRCAQCGVKIICDEMIEKAKNLEEETLNLIDGLITHFEEMKVSEAIKC